MRICSIHFKGGKLAKYYDEKNSDWIPTIKMGYNTNTSKASTPKLERYHRANKRLKLKPTSLFNNDPTSVVGPVNPHNNMNIEEPIVITSDNQHIDNVETGTSCNTDLKMADIKEFLQLKTKFTKLQNELNYYNLSEKSFDGREKMFTYYTGLESIAVFNLILDYIKSGLTAKNQRLSKSQKLLLCLMKLRLNLPLTDIGFRFNISCSTASLIFRKVIYLLEHMFKKLIYWPEREALRSIIPMSFFKTFGNNVAVIINCFEIGIEKPSSLKAKAQTWSSYKNKNIVKYLIAITPQGVISFISQGWGWRTSDKYITENCNLLPGDVVLADQGFTISESVGFHCATLKTSAFTKGVLPLTHAPLKKHKK